MKSTLKRLDTVHQQLTTTISAVDPALLVKRPAENEWSVAQVVEHLCLVEGAVTKYLKSKLDQPPVKVSFLKKLVPMKIVSLRMKCLQAPKIVEPATDLPPMAELLKKYDHLRSQTRELLRSGWAATPEPNLYEASVLWRYGRRGRSLDDCLSRTTPPETDSRDPEEAEL